MSIVQCNDANPPCANVIYHYLKLSGQEGSYQYDIVGDTLNIHLNPCQAPYLSRYVKVK